MTGYEDMENYYQKDLKAHLDHGTIQPATGSLVLVAVSMAMVADAVKNASYVVAREIKDSCK